MTKSDCPTCSFARFLIPGAGSGGIDRPGLPSGRAMRRYLVTVLLAAMPCLFVASHYHVQWVRAQALNPQVAAPAAEAAAPAEAAPAADTEAAQPAAEAGEVAPAAPATEEAAAPAEPPSVAAAAVRVPLMAVAAILTSILVELAFARIRKRPVSGGGAVYGLVLALMVPPTVPIWMVVAGAAFGTVFGKEVFGGTGAHIFSPALVAKGFMIFSYPAIVRGAYFGSMGGFTQVPDAWLMCAAVTLGGGLLIGLSNPGNLRIPVAGVLAAVCTAVPLTEFGLMPYESPVELIGADGFLFTLCFLASDPACAPKNKDAKWFYGFFIGAIAVLMRAFSNYSEAMMAAVLVGNVFSPTLDALADVRLSTGEDN